MSDITPYTPGMREVIKLSKAEAGRLGQDYIGPEHFLLAMIRRREGLAVQTLTRMGVELEDLKMKLEQMLQAANGPNLNLFRPNDEAKKALETAKDIARNMKHNWLGTEHMLLAIIHDQTTASSRVLAKLGVTFNAAEKTVLDVVDGLPPTSPGQK